MELEHIWNMQFSSILNKTFPPSEFWLIRSSNGSIIKIQSLDILWDIMSCSQFQKHLHPEALHYTITSPYHTFCVEFFISTKRLFKSLYYNIILSIHFTFIKKSCISLSSTLFINFPPFSEIHLLSIFYTNIHLKLLVKRSILTIRTNLNNIPHWRIRKIPILVK